MVHAGSRGVLGPPVWQAGGSEEGELSRLGDIKCRPVRRRGECAGAIGVSSLAAKIARDDPDAERFAALDEAAQILPLAGGGAYLNTHPQGGEPCCLAR